MVTTFSAGTDEWIDFFKILWQHDKSFFVCAEYLHQPQLHFAFSANKQMLVLTTLITFPQPIHYNWLAM